MQKIKVLSIRKVVCDETKAVRNQLRAPHWMIGQCLLLRPESGWFLVPDQKGVSLQPGPTCTCKASGKIGKVCEVHQSYQSMSLLAALYSRTDPAPPANNMTFLAAGGINDPCNYSSYALYEPMWYLLTCPRVHCISLQHFFCCVKKTLKSEMMKIGRLCQTHIHWELSLQGCKTCLSLRSK